MAEGPKKFGRYFLLDLVAQGGMAEIYRARLASSEGAGRLLVIKRIQPSYGTNSEFLSMFKSEIKVTMGFNHPNIVQLYDFGEEQEQPYIAMEFVDGRNLRQFMTRFLDLKQRFPIDLAVHIIEQAACGLHYAHSFRDKITGQPLNVVHRDISPQNLLISYEGTVKVIDFGIAKAATNLESTRVGVIKGKPSYLSPEQINGDVLDGRADIFSLGTVLWELLAGKKLFSGENDLAVLKLIESCQTHVKPPSTINPNVPLELDYIVLKALAKHREKRYQTAEEFQRALHKFLYSFMPDFNPSDLSYYAKDLFKKEIVEDRMKIQKLNAEVEKLLVRPEELMSRSALMANEGDTDDQPEPELATSDELQKPAGAPAPVSRGAAPRRRPVSVSPSFTMLEKPKEAAMKVEIESTIASPAPRYRSASSHSIPALQKGLLQSKQTRLPHSKQVRRPARTSDGPRGLPVAVAVALVTVALFGKDLGIRIPILTDIPDFVESLIGGGTRLVLEGNERNVRVMVNDKVVADHLPVTLQRPDLPVGIPFKISVQSQDDRGFDAEITLKRGEQQQVPVVLARRSIASVPPTFPVSQLPPPTIAHGARSILLRLNVMPSGNGTEVTVNGTRVNMGNPVIQVGLDTDLELIARRRGYTPKKQLFVLNSREMTGLKEWVMPITLDPVHFGYLNLKSTPSATATFMVDGQLESHMTPLSDMKLPVGNYTIHLVNQVLGMEKTVTLTLQEGQVVTLDVPLDIKD